MDLHASLADPRRYASQIDRLHRRYAASRALYALEQRGVSLASVSLHRDAVARRLARAVADGAYRLGPARLRRISVDGKRREVFACRLTDLIVHGVVAEVIQDATTGLLSPRLYSYRKGLSWWRPIRELAAYVRAHRRERPDPRTRGLYVLRRDIHAYTDSIPVRPGSPLWPMLAGLDVPPGHRRLVEAVIRPAVVWEGGGMSTLYRGVPTGQPISCVLFNLYLAGLDRELDALPGGFYARYCDDILFAHADPEVVRDVDARIEAGLARLELEINPRKSRTLYLTGAGRASVIWKDAAPATSVPFLGCMVSARGTISLGRRKRRALLTDLRTRAERTARALGTATPDEVGRVVCAVLNQALQARAEFSRQRSAALLRRAVTDRGDLRQLDDLIARIVAETVARQPGGRAFRAAPYRTIRRDWRLLSLLHARNRWRPRPAH